MASVKRSAPPKPPARPSSAPARSASTKPASKPTTPARAGSSKPATTTKGPSSPVRDPSARFQDNLSRKLDEKTRATLRQPSQQATRLDQKLQRRMDEKVTQTVTRRLTEKLSKPQPPRRAEAQPTSPLAAVQRVGEAIQTGAGVVASTRDALGVTNQAVKQLIDADLARKVPAAVQAAVKRIDSKSAQLESLVKSIEQAGKAPTGAQLARLRTLQRDIRVNSNAVLTSGPEALAALGTSEAYQRAQAGLTRLANNPQAKRALKGLEVVGKAADLAGAAKAAYDAYSNSVFSSRTGRAIDAGLTGAVNLGANTAFGVADLGLTVLGVDEKNRIAPTVTQASRAITSGVLAFATGDTTAIQRYREQVQDGPVLLKEFDDIGQRLSDTRVLDFGFSLLDTVLGRLTGDEARVRRAQALRDDG